MKKRRGSRDEESNTSGPSWRVVLASLIFVAWMISSAIILYISKTTPSAVGDKLKQEQQDKPAQQTAAPKEAAVSFSTAIETKGKHLLQFKFPPTITIGSIGTIDAKPLGTVHGKVITSALEVERSDLTVAQGTITMPADQKLSFVPGEMLAVNPSSLSHFRPGEIYDITMKRVQDIDVDVYIEACSQIKGVTRLDLSNCPDLTKEGAPFIEGYESLKQLNLCVSRGAMPIVAKLGALKKVESLGLYSNYDISPILPSLRASINLKALKIRSPILSDESLKTIAALLILDELSIASPVFNQPEAVASTLRILSHCTHLKVLTLETSNIDQPARLSPSGEKALQACKSLEIMTLNKSGNLIKGN